MINIKLVKKNMTTQIEQPTTTSPPAPAQPQTNAPASPATEPKGNYFDTFKAGNLVSSRDTLKNSWRVYKENWGNYAILIVLTMAVIIIPMIIFGIVAFASLFLPALKNLPNLAAQGAGAFPIQNLPILIILIVLFMPVVILASIFFQFAITNQVVNSEKKPDLKTILKLTWHKYWSLLWVSILSGLIIFGGMMVFVIPGIVLAFYFSFSLYVVLAEDIRGFAALKRSAKIVHGYGWALLRRWVVWVYLIGVLILLSMIPILGWFLQILMQFILPPLAIIYYFSVYLNFTDRQAKNQHSDNLSTTNKLVTVLFIVIPVIIMISLFALIAIFSVTKNSKTEGNQPGVFDQYIKKNAVNEQPFFN